ncbi:MAG TPA: AAA family ATPase [Myxococcota bacterium]|nr:AAA family ATPase [Myxococcota bacterium]
MMPLPQRLHRQLGTPVTGDRFFDREAEVGQLLDHLENGEHVLIASMRRIGKTSLMREVERRLEGKLACVFIDVEGCREAADVIAELAAATRPHQGLWSRARAVFHNALDKVDEVQLEVIRVQLRDSLRGDWRPKADRLLADLADGGPGVVVMIDELAILVHRMLEDDTRGRAEVDLLISWVREASIRHAGRIRFVIAGSVGLEPVLQRAGLTGQLNTFVPLDLEPWPRDVAAACLRALAAAHDHRWTEGAVEATLDKLGCYVPHHVQMFFHHLHAHAKREGSVTTTPDDVERVWRERMLSPRGHAELTHFEDRLRKVVPIGWEDQALLILTHAAVTGSVDHPQAAKLCRVEPPDDFIATRPVRRLLQVLEHDSYLRRDGDRLVFTSALVRAWWRERHGSGYRPT